MSYKRLINKIKNIASDSYDRNISAELVYLLYNQARPAIFGSLIAATVLAVALYKTVELNVLVSWYTLVLGVTLSRYSLVKAYLEQKNLQANSDVWRRYFILMTACAGFIWSLASVILTPSVIGNQVFIVCVLAGVSAGAVPFYAGSRIACALFVMPILLTFAISVMMRGGPSYELLAFLTLIFLGLLLISSLRTHKAIYNAVKLKFKNDELVKDLSITQKKMALINDSLQAEMVERNVAEKLLKESEAQYRLVTDALPVLISYIDNDLYFRYNNKAYEDWFAKSLKDITSHPVKDIFGSVAFAIFMENYEKLTTQYQVNYETVLQFHNDEERYVSVTLIPHIREDGVRHGVFSLISDMTPRINYLATHDALTGLPNRSLFTARFSKALKLAHRNNSRIALLFLDLDHFKNINDTLGHDVGDQLLIKVTERIKSNIGEDDTLARFGGDEFMVLMKESNAKHIVETAKKLREAFTLPFHVSGHDVFTTTSIGISVYPDDGTDMQMLLKNADMAIYRAKEKGRNTFEFYTTEMNEKIQRKLTIQTSLRAAIDKNEFVLHYQPIIDIFHNMTTSYEVLLRWTQPELGVISPMEFIPAAEEAGLIVPIGEWVLRHACRQIAKWIEADTLTDGVRFSINLSARQFKEPNFADVITQVLLETGVGGDRLTFELTESLIMQDVEHSSLVIKALKRLGVAISIDDFGTGYSSLNYLRRFPIDIIKIDRSFISDLTGNSDDAAIVTAIIAMAHSLKMKVIAEGVETVGQYQFLYEHDCDEVQGYYFARPMPAGDLDEYMRNPLAMMQHEGTE